MANEPNLPGEMPPYYPSLPVSNDGKYHGLRHHGHQSAMDPAGVHNRIWTLIREHGEKGLACWEIEQIMGALHQSVSATLTWLWYEDWIIRVGKNKTPSGYAAHIYRAVRAD